MVIWPYDASKKEQMNTKIISCAGEKGGCGKTTINIILATNLFFTHKKSVVLIDLDNPQYSIYKKRKRDLAQLRSEEKDDLNIYPIEKSNVEGLHGLIKDYYGKVEYIILDFPGNLNKEMVKGLMYVEHIFIPFFLDELEIDSTAVFYKTLKSNFLENNERVLQGIHLFFNRYQKIKVNKFANIREAFTKADMPMMTSVVMDRTIYRERYRNTIFPIPESQEYGELELHSFINEVIEKTN